MTTYTDRQDARRSRLEERAEKAEARAAAAHNSARGTLDGIPMGQPILVGHHSERRHRRDLERADARMRRSAEEAAKAERLRQRAASVGTGGIASDDPDAIALLREKLAGLEGKLAHAKQVRAALRGPDAERKLLALGVPAITADHLVRCGGAYLTRNVSAEIRRVKGRIEELEKIAARPAREPVHHGGIEIREDRDEGRVCIEFPGKPSEEARAALKGAGWRWNRTLGCWTRKLTDAAWRSALLVTGAAG